MTQTPTGDPNNIPGTEVNEGPGLYPEGTVDPAYAAAYPPTDGTDPNSYPPEYYQPIDPVYHDPLLDTVLDELHNLHERISHLEEHNHSANDDGPDPAQEALGLLHDINSKLDSHINDPVRNSGPVVYEGHVTLHPIGGHQPEAEYDTATGA